MLMGERSLWFVAIFLPLHVSESFPYSRGRLWLGVCLPGQYAQLCVSVWFLCLSGCVCLLESEAFHLLFPVPGMPFPTSPFGSPFFTFFSVRKYGTHSFYHP